MFLFILFYFTIVIVTSVVSIIVIEVTFEVDHFEPIDYTLAALVGICWPITLPFLLLTGIVKALHKLINKFTNKRY